MAIPFLKGIDVAGAVDLSNLTIDGAQGTDGQVLTSTGSGIAWEDASGTSLSGGEASKVAVWSATDTLTHHDNFHFDTTNVRLGIGDSNPNRTLVVSETRTGSTASDAYTAIVKSVQSSGASPNPGTGGLKVQYTSSSNNVHAFGLVAGSSSSDFLTTGPMHFYTNSDLDTVSATGFAMQLDTSQRLILGSMTASQKLNVSGNVTANRYYGNGTTAYYLDPNDVGTSIYTVGDIRTASGFTSDGLGKLYAWRAVDNTTSNSTNYVKIARLTGTAAGSDYYSDRCIIELAGRSTSYSNNQLPAMGYIVAQLQSDANWDVVYYNHHNGTDEVVDEVGVVQINNTQADIYVRVGTYAEVTASAHISDGYITVDNTRSGSAPSGYSAANAEYKVWNSGNDGSGSGLDSDTVDGIQGASFLRSDANDTFTGKLSVGSTSSRSAGVYGIYDSTKTGHIWSMGTAYAIPNDGSNFGNLYGLAYKHTNNTTGGTMGGAHQMVWCDNGSPRGSIGYNSVWHAESMKAPIFYDSNNTGYYADPASTTTSISLAGRITGNSQQVRVKYSVWSGDTYGIGMKSGFSYGHLGDYAMSFQMNDDSDRGWWWGDTAHTDAQGAMSLTTNGRLTVATSLSVGQGASVTSPSTVPLFVDGFAVFDTTSGTEPVCITRSGSTSSQALKIGVTDTQAQFVYIEDTSSEGTGNFGKYQFYLGGNAGESNIMPFEITKDNSIFSVPVKIETTTVPRLTIGDIDNTSNSSSGAVLEMGNRISSGVVGSSTINLINGSFSQGAIQFRHGQATIGGDIADPRAMISSSYTGSTTDYNLQLSHYNSSTVDNYMSMRADHTYFNKEIRIGGTGAANGLDDYEEGTYNLKWSLGSANTSIYEVTTSNFGSSAANSSKYVKIGRVVHIFLDFEFNAHPSNWASSGSYVYLTNLPFSPLQGSVGGNFSMQWNSDLSSTEQIKDYGGAGHFGQHASLNNNLIQLGVSGRYSPGYYSYWSNTGSLLASDFPGPPPGGANAMVGHITYYTNA